MKDKVLELLPEINEIKDPDLRAKVIACWTEAIAYRNWKFEELRSIPFTLLADDVKDISGCIPLAIFFISIKIQ